MNGGVHIILDMKTDGSHNESGWLFNIDAAKYSFGIAATESGATILHENWHSFGKEAGFTGMLLLSESHMSIHTYPEENYASIDIYMCGKADPFKAMNYLLESLPHTAIGYTVIPRNSNFNRTMTDVSRLQSGVDGSLRSEGDANGPVPDLAANPG